MGHQVRCGALAKKSATELAAAHRDLAEWRLGVAQHRGVQTPRSPHGPGTRVNNWLSTACVGRARPEDGGDQPCRSLALVSPGDVPKWWRDVHVGSPRPRRGHVATQAPICSWLHGTLPCGASRPMEAVAEQLAVPAPPE